MLYSYKMTHDRGFAPNPFHGIMTLATCKPFIRETKGEGMYVAGFTSKDLCGDNVGEERLVYIMKISSTLSYEAYFSSKEFQCKKYSDKDGISKVGDNIYYLEQGEYKQIRGLFHRKKVEKERDLKSKQVLIAEEFFYFGSGAVSIDKKFKITIPKTQMAYGVITKDQLKIDEFWKYLETTFKKNIPLHPPHGWNSEDEFNYLKPTCY